MQDETSSCTIKQINSVTFEPPRQNFNQICRAGIIRSLRVVKPEFHVATLVHNFTLHLSGRTGRDAETCH